MFGFVQGFDFFNMPAEKYWSFPKGYKGNKSEEIKNAIFSEQYTGSTKVDGHYYMFIKDEDGNLIFRPREKGVSGEFVNKAEWIPHICEEMKHFPNGTAFVGELYFPEHEGSRNVTTVMGCKADKAVARQKENEALHYYIFDVYAYNNDIFYRYDMRTRSNFINEDLKEIIMQNECHCVESATYYTGEDLWNLLDYNFVNGREGIVITKLNSKPESGKRTARKTIKVKKELVVEADCFFTGNWKPAVMDYTGKNVGEWTYWYDTKNDKKLMGQQYVNDYLNGLPIIPVSKGFYYGWAGSLEFGVYSKTKDEIVPLGWIKNLPEEVKIDIVRDRTQFIKLPVKISAMEIENDTRKFRHAKVVEIRSKEDIDWKECSWEKLFGE